MSEDNFIYIFVNNDLKMSTGKVDSQVGHVVLKIVEHVLNNKKSQEYLRYQEWKKNGQTKIVLKANQNDLMELIKLPESKYIIDAGKTQISPNSLTVVGFFPNIHQEFKKFPLL